MKNKNILIQKNFNKADQLTLQNKIYQQSVHDLIVWLLENDKVDDDITSKLLFSENKVVSAQIISKQKLTIAGLEEIEYLLQKFTKIDYEILFNDGDKIGEKVIIAELSGDAKEILAYERVMLNILQRLSGIATETQNIVSKIKNGKPFIAATRKTPWGLLDKKAVTIGGGLTHRLNLSNNILVKDNHLTQISAIDALSKILKQTDNALIEIEIEDKKTLLQLVDIFAKANANQNVIPDLIGDPEKTIDSRLRGNDKDRALSILLDNFSPQKVKKIFAENKFPENIIFEASGGITTKNIEKWLNTSVDILSLGSLTHSPKAANISLDMLK